MKKLLVLVVVLVLFVGFFAASPLYKVVNFCKKVLNFFRAMKNRLIKVMFKGDVK
jgi:cytochrome c oxidase assembly protein Cox11